MIEYFYFWFIDKTLTGTTTLGQNWPRSNSNEEVIYIPQSDQNEGSPSDAV